MAERAIGWFRPVAVLASFNFAGSKQSFNRLMYEKVLGVQRGFAGSLQPTGLLGNQHRVYEVPAVRSSQSVYVARTVPVTSTVRVLPGPTARRG